MSEKQEKAWVVMRADSLLIKDSEPVKVFDDRADARAYAKRWAERTKARLKWWVVGVKKG